MIQVLGLKKSWQRPCITSPLLLPVIMTQCPVIGLPTAKIWNRVFLAVLECQPSSSIIVCCLECPSFLRAADAPRRTDDFTTLSYKMILFSEVLFNYHNGFLFKQTTTGITLFSVLMLWLDGALLTRMLLLHGVMIF